MEDYDDSLTPALFGDVDRIQQVLINLTSNARKFVPLRGGIIRIKAALCLEESSSQLRVSVANNGDSIAMEEQMKLFKPFAKLSDP